MGDYKEIKRLIKRLCVVFATSFNHFLAILLIGFIGGAMYPCLQGWIKTSTVPPSSSDAIAIANTYIVFTTIIFVGVTVILAIAGYIFTQKISESQETQETRIVEHLIKDVQKNEQLGTKLIQAILANGDVQRLLDGHIRSKVEESLQSISADEVGSVKRSTSRINAAQAMSERISKNGGNHD
jgi:predicted PurR-regulated permease PerM